MLPTTLGHECPAGLRGPLANADVRLLSERARAAAKRAAPRYDERAAAGRSRACEVGAKAAQELSLELREPAEDSRDAAAGRPAARELALCAGLPDVRLSQSRHTLRMMAVSGVVALGGIAG
jgi:hypothetical protein